MIAAKYWHRIGTRNWTFAAEERTKKNGEQSYFALEYATDTKIIRFKKIVSNANPFDERWSGYYEERDGEKMLNSTNGREKLLKYGEISTAVAQYAMSLLPRKRVSRFIRCSEVGSRRGWKWCIPNAMPYCTKTILVLLNRVLTGAL